MSSDDFQATTEQYLTRVSDTLERWLPAADQFPAVLHEAMRYACRGGKRLRAMLVYATADVIELPRRSADPLAAAVELIHAYSLVHDDLPAMDDDDLRRGQPTCHKAFDEATAILVGDALQTLAFRVLAHDKDCDLEPAQRLKVIDLLAEASGSHGMVGGQAVDIHAVGQDLNLAEIEAMHIHKTGALIRSCMLMTAHARAGLSDQKINALDHFGKCLGLAFQIQDDVLDEIGETEDLGKSNGADRHLNKPTFTSLLGLSQAKSRADELFLEAMASLQPFSGQEKPLVTLAKTIQQRRK